MTLHPGDNVEITLKFIWNQGDHQVYFSNLVIKTDNTKESEIIVGLGGIYMAFPQGVNEANTQYILNGFGVNVELDMQWMPNLSPIGNGMVLREFPNIPFYGDEIRSGLWSQNDGRIPVFARQLAAFHPVK